MIAQDRAAEESAAQDTPPTTESVKEAESKARTRIDIETDARRKATDAARGKTAALIERVADRIGARAGVQAAFGEPIEREGRIVVPVAQSVWGIGGGGGESEEQGSGSGIGGGTMARPLGYLDITGDRAEFVPLGKPWQDARLVIAWAFAIWLISRAVNRILRG